jgi:hypothetical protein
MKNTISDLITRPWSMYVLFAAVRLKVFTILADRKMTAEEIAGECGAVPRLLKALLDACAGMELISLEGDRYANSPFSRTHLVEGQPQYMGDFSNILSGQTPAWLKLADVVGGKVRSGEAPITEELDIRTFTLGMNNIGTLGEAEALKNAVDLSGCREMVDAGGGSGLYSALFCREYPDLRSTILDQKEALAAAREITGAYPERERLRFREADITRDSFGENVDAVLLWRPPGGARLLLRSRWGESALRIAVRAQHADHRSDPGDPGGGFTAPMRRRCRVYRHRNSDSDRTLHLPDGQEGVGWKPVFCWAA